MIVMHSRQTAELQCIGTIKIRALPHEHRSNVDRIQLGRVMKWRLELL